MIYNPFTIPIRSAIFDGQGHLTKAWVDFLSGVARKAGRSITWRGDYRPGTGRQDSQQYVVGDVVRLKDDNSFWHCLQGQPYNGVETAPGTDETIWEHLFTPLPAKGTDGQVLAKASDADYDTKWEDAPTGGGGSGTVTHTGGALTADLPIFGAGADDIKPGTKSGNTNEVATVSGSLTAGNFLTADASGNVVDGGSAPGSGTVTSVAISMPAEFSVSGSPVTGSGTIAITKADETANQVFAGPTTGSPAAPAFRALVAADIPAIAESGVTNLTSDLALKAPLASPALTGNPTAPTPTAGDNDTSIATTAFVAAAVASGVAGVVVPSNEGGATHQFLTAYNSSTGAFSKAQPAAADLTDAAAITAGVIGCVIDGSGSVPTTGSRGFVQVPYGCTITGWTLLADASGSAQITVKKSSYAGFPTTSSIVASAPPNLASAQGSTSTTLTGWTTAIAAGDVLEFNLDSVATCKRLTLELKVTKS